MPFKSKAQMGKFSAMEARGQLLKGTARNWAHETPNIAQLPEHVTHPKTSQGLKRMADGGVVAEQKEKVAGAKGGALTLKAKIKVKAKGNAKLPEAKDLPGLLRIMGGSHSNSGTSGKKRKVRFGGHAA